MGTTQPDPASYNVDLAAQALLDHLQGKAVLPANKLNTGKHCRRSESYALLHLAP